MDAAIFVLSALYFNLLIDIFDLVHVSLLFRARLHETRSELKPV